MQASEQSLYPVFQPIVDIRKRQAIGYESLIRSSAGISPPELFAMARRTDTQLEFDRQCRSLALQQFPQLCCAGKNKLLFLNVDISALDNGLSIEGHIAEQVRESGLHPTQIALELVESNVESTDRLIDFAARYREAGFLIVLDDFGESHSNLNRVVQLKPDIIKIDKALIRNCHLDYYKQSIVQTITRLSDKIGALTLAEGVEHREELIACYGMGIHLYQGYFFARPQSVDDLPGSACVSKLIECQPDLHASVTSRLEADRSRYRAYEMLSQSIIHALQQASDEINGALYDVIANHDEIDCIYLLNDDGIQISDTVCHSCSGNMHALFSPSVIGADHSLKAYYFSLHCLDQPRYISEPYISQATGNLCRTVASRFAFRGKASVLCVDYLCHNDQQKRERGERRVA